MRVTERLRAEGHGFTLIEVMVSCLLLAIGVLGTVSLVDQANRTTSATRAREGATNLARGLVESARAVPYSTLTTSGAAAQVQTQPGLADADAATPGWQIKRRNVTYTVTFNACTVDDPADGYGTDDSEFCTIQTPSSTPDNRPADYKRVTATVTWKDPSGTHTQTQAGVIPSSYHGPSVLSITPSIDPTQVFTSTVNPGSVNFSITTTSGTSRVDLSVDGNSLGSATGGGTSWVYNWNLGEPTGSGASCNLAGTGVTDGTYIVQADAYDADGLSENSRAVTLKFNRCAPLPPTGFIGGKNYLWPGAEFQWDPSPEEDVVGYYMYEANSATAVWPSGWTRVGTPVPVPDPSQPTCDGLIKTPNCVDSTPTGKAYYRLTAVDTDPNGNLRESDPTAVLTVDPSNSRPGKPGPGADGSAPYSIHWGMKSYPDPPPSDYTDFYYIYRDTNNGRPDRYDSVDNNPAGGNFIWTDPDPGTGSHTYWVTAVDNHLAESDFAPGNGITLP